MVQSPPIERPVIKTGDTVRVVLEGKSNSQSRPDGRFSIGEGLGFGNVIFPQAGHVVSIEVLPQPVQVGDYIKGQAAYAALPEGSVVRHTAGVCVKNRNGKWYDSAACVSWDSLDLGRELIYLPE